MKSRMIEKKNEIYIQKGRESYSLNYIEEDACREPEIIIFDEATSALDSLTEKEITETVKKVSKSRPDLIVISIAHRLSTIAHVDKTYVMEKGKIIERGNHKSLLKKKGLYSALWTEQVAED